MNTRDNAPDSLDLPAEEPTGVAAQNIARLVGESYQPEAADPAFVRRVEDRLYEVAAEMAAFRVPIRVPEQEP